MSSILSSAEMDKIICHCLRVTESQICNVLESGNVRHVYDVMDETRAGSNCNSCKRDIKKVMADQRPKPHSLWQQLRASNLWTAIVDRFRMN